jgi:hypothetical protein
VRKGPIDLRISDMLGRNVSGKAGMGSFISTDWVLRVHDRVLTQLQYVVVQQFRRGEAFLLSWLDGEGGDAVERSLWLSPAVPVGFEFDSADTMPLELAWVTALASAAGSAEGLRIVDADGRPLTVPTEMRH